MADWQDHKTAVDGAVSGLSAETLADSIAKINAIGHQIFVNSWQDITP
jgi:hypothetical protein